MQLLRYDVVVILIKNKHEEANYIPGNFPDDMDRNRDNISRDGFRLLKIHIN